MKREGMGYGFLYVSKNDKYQIKKKKKKNKKKKKKNFLGGP